MELPYVANVCQPYDYRPHSRTGGPEAFRDFCTAAHARDIKVVHWLGMPSPHAPDFKKNPDWIIRYDSGARWDGNYTTINSASIRRSFGAWLLDQLRNLKDLGLDGVFIDSYHNLWAMPIDYGQPDLRPQFPDLLELHREIERLGLFCWTESFSPIGITSAGLWPQYSQCPEMSYWTHFRSLANTQVPGKPNNFRNGQIPPELYWRMLAHKSPIGVSVLEFDDMPFEGLPDLPPVIGEMNLAYNALSLFMQVRTLQVDGSVAWFTHDGDAGAVFGLDGRITVPEGYRGTAIYGANDSFAAGSHSLAGQTALKLRRL